MKQNNSLKNQSAGIKFYYYWRGWAYQNLGKDQQAIQDFHLAAELGETNAQRYLLLVKK